MKYTAEYMKEKIKEYYNSTFAFETRINKLKELEKLTEVEICEKYNEIFNRLNLEDGDIFLFAGGDEGVYIEKFDIILCKSGGYVSGGSYNRDFSFFSPLLSSDYEIDKVLRPERGWLCTFGNSELNTDYNGYWTNNNYIKLIYSKKESVKEMTLKEIEEKLGYKIKIVG